MERSCLILEINNFPKDRKELARSFLGQTVYIKIDRPLGSVHPKHKNIVYSVNYGYIPDVLGGDGEDFDVYLLGVNTSVSEYTAKVIGIVYRLNDAEDKLVAAPEGMTFAYDEIRQAVNFQEKYFIYEIEI